MAKAFFIRARFFFSLYTYYNEIKMAQTQITRQKSSSEFDHLISVVLLYAKKPNLFNRIIQYLYLKATAPGRTNLNISPIIYFTCGTSGSASLLTT